MSRNWAYARFVVLAAALLATGCKGAPPPSPPDNEFVRVYDHKAGEFVEVEVEIRDLRTVEVEDGVEKIVARGNGSPVTAYERATVVIPPGASDLSIGQTLWVVSPNSDDAIGYARSKLTNVSRPSLIGGFADMLQQQQVETWRFDFKPHVGKVYSRRSEDGSTHIEIPPNLGPGRYVVTDRKRYFVIDVLGPYSRWKEMINDASLSKRYPFGISAYFGASFFRNEAFNRNVGAFAPLTVQGRFGSLYPFTFDVGLQLALINAKSVDDLVSFSLFTAASIDALWFTRHLGLRGGVGAKIHSVGFLRSSDEEDDSSEFLTIGSVFFRSELMIPIMTRLAISIIYDRSLAATRNAQWHDINAGFRWRF